MSTIEQTVVTVPVKWSAETRSETGGLRIKGTAVVYGQPSHPIPFTETIRRGALTRALARPDTDLRLLRQHDDTLILARQSAGSLTVNETPAGLEFTADIVPTSFGQDTALLVKTGHLTECSFAFVVKRDKWSDDGKRREILEIERVDELSLCDRGAYGQTTVEARSRQATLARIERVVGPGSTRTIKLREQGPYGEGSKFSYFRDLLVASEAERRKNDQALAIVNRGTPTLEDMPSPMESPIHGGTREALRRLDTAKRDIGSGSGFDNWVPVSAGGAFVGDLFATSVRNAAALASALTQGPLPKGGQTITAPKFASGVSVAIQTENSAVSETDAVTSGLAATVQMQAGQQDVALQLLDQADGSFDAALSAELGRALGASTDAAVLATLLAVSGAVSVVWTDATPTVPENWSKIVDLRSQTHSALGSEPTLAVLHPRRLAYLDTSAVEPLQWRGQILSTPAIGTAYGGGTEDRLLWLAPQWISFLSRPPEINVYIEPLSANLTVRFSVHQLSATLVRQAKSVGILSGSGMAAPVMP